MVQRIRDLALAHPAYGCNRHEAKLGLEGIRVPAITIQKILNDNCLGTRVERWLARAPIEIVMSFVRQEG
jgi:hypothetical protein